MAWNIASQAMFKWHLWKPVKTFTWFFVLPQTTSSSNLTKIILGEFKRGVPQGSILGPLLFLIHVNNLSNGMSSNCKFFADDISLFSVSNQEQLPYATI